MSQKNKEVPLDVKAVSIIRDHYAAMEKELTELLKQQVPQEVKDTPKTPQKAPTDIQQLFPKELSELLNFEDQGKWIKISPKQFLGSDNFAQVLAIVKELQGEYVSAGKNSHFRIPKTYG